MWILRSIETEQEHTLRFQPGAVKTVGRGRRSDFVIDAALMSRVHCRFSASTEQLVVEDLQSTNGTYVNNNRVTCLALKDGDQLRLGHLEFLVSRE